MVNFLPHQEGTPAAKPPKRPVDDIRYTQPERLSETPTPEATDPPAKPATRRWWPGRSSGQDHGAHQKVVKNGAMRLVQPHAAPTAPPLLRRQATSQPPAPKPPTARRKTWWHKLWYRPATLTTKAADGRMHVPNQVTGAEVPPPMEVDLVADKGILFVPEDFRRRLTSHLAVVVVVIGLLAGGYLWLVWQTQTPHESTADIDAAIVTATRQLADFRTQRDALAADEERFVRLRELLDEHRFWSRFFTLLERTTIPGVAYRSVVADTEGRIIVTAQATSYLAVAQQLAVWQETAGIEAIDFSTAGVPATANQTAPPVVFTTAITILPEFFRLTSL